MADSTTNIPQISQAQAQHDVSVNGNFDAASPGMIFGRNFETTAALTFGYIGGKAPVSGEPVDVPNGTVALTASATNYVYAQLSLGSPEGWSVEVDTSAPSGWPGPLTDQIALYTIVTGPASVTSIVDHRIAGLFASVSTGGGGVTSIPAVIQIAVSDETTAITTGAAKVTFRMPHAMTVTEVRASLTASSSSGAPQVDINEGGSSILSTKLTIDQGEKTSTTAATPAVISDGSLADDAEITIDIDTAGTGAAGLKVSLIGERDV